METKIEELVRTRKSTLACAEIRKYVRDAHGGIEQIVKASDWYRRLGLSAEAFRLLLKAGSDKRISLMLARILHQIGANEYGYQVLSRIELKTSEDYRLAGQIQIENFYCESAIRSFERMFELDREPGSYASRVSRIEFADAVSGSGLPDQAYSIVAEVLHGSSEPLLRSICLQAQGEYLARQERFEESLALLEQAEAIFPEDAPTMDRFILLKWLAYARAHLGFKKESKRLFKEAERVLDTLGIRIEVRLHLYALKMKAGLLSSADWKRVCFYPGLSDGFKRELARFAPAAMNGFFGGKKAKLILYPESDELALAGRRSTGLGLEEMLLSAVLIAGPWGLSLNRVKSLLWPDEVYNFLKLDNRVHALIKRLKVKYRIQISIRGGVLLLAAGCESRVGVHADESAIPSLLFRSSGFSRAEFSHYYGLSPTQAKQRLKAWLGRGWIRMEGVGPNTRYSVGTGIGSPPKSIGQSVK